MLATLRLSIFALAAALVKGVLADPPQNQTIEPGNQPSNADNITRPPPLPIYIPISIGHLPVVNGLGPQIIPSKNCSAAVSTLTSIQELDKCLGLTNDKYSALQATVGKPGESVAWQFGDFLGQTFCPAPSCAPDVLDDGILKPGANCSDAGSHSTHEDDDDADDNDKDQDNDDKDEGKAAAPSSAPEPSEATFLTLLISSYQLQRNISCLVNLLAGPPPEHPMASLGGNALCFIKLLKAIKAHTDVVFDSETLVRMKMVDHALMREISEKVTKNGTGAVKEVFCTDCHKASVNYLFGGKLKDATAAGSNATLDANKDPYDLPATSAQLTGKAAPFARRFLVQNCGEAFVDGEMPKTVKIRTGPEINDHSNGTSSAQSQAVNGTKHGNGASMSVARVEGARWGAAPFIGAVGAFVGGLMI